MKLNFAICLVHSLSSWWQQPLGKLQPLVPKWSNDSNSFASKNHKTTLSLSAEVDRVDLSAFLTELRGVNRV